MASSETETLWPSLIEFMSDSLTETLTPSVLFFAMVIAAELDELVLVLDPELEEELIEVEEFEPLELDELPDDELCEETLSPFETDTVQTVPSQGALTVRSDCVSIASL